MNKKGFTLIELLVVIAIIGVLSTLAVVALGSARQKANDAKRLSDIRQVQTALELYYTDNNAYPTTTATGITLGDSTHSCLDTNGFSASCTSPYMGLVPSDPINSDVNIYTYTAEAGTAYQITASLEVGAGGFDFGAVTATESGIVGQ